MNYQIKGWFWEPPELAVGVRSEDSIGYCFLKPCILANFGYLCMVQFPKMQCARVKEEIRKIKLIKKNLSKDEEK